MADDTPTPPEERAHDDEVAGSQPEVPAPEEEPTAAAEEPATEEPATEEPATEEPAPAGEEAPAEEVPAAEEQPVAEKPAAPTDEEPQEPREKPAIPGADLELDLVLGDEERARDPYADYDEDVAPDDAGGEDDDVVADEPVVATIDLAAGARYTATGKRKTSVARVILKPGTGAYTINGKDLDNYFPRPTLQRQIRQPLESVGFDDRMDVVARLHGGGVSAQAGALRHGISRALLDADPNLRGELKRRGFLTRDARVKERKKAGLKKARKRPQFSKR
jgi:small subunit ribosomal protein S9